MVNLDGSSSGSLTVYLRLSCIGRTIITSFVFGSDGNFVFKGNDEEYNVIMKKKNNLVKTKAPGSFIDSPETIAQIKETIISKERQNYICSNKHIMDIPCRKSELVIKDGGNKKVVQVVDGDHLNDDKMLETFSDILQKGNSGFGDTKTKVLKNLNTNFVVSTAKTEPLTVQKPLKVQKPTSNKSVPITESKTKDKSQLNLANKVDVKTGSFTISSKNSSACSVKRSSFISRKGDYVDLEQEYKFMDAQKKANDAADKNKPTLFKSMVFRKLDDASRMSQGDDTSNDGKPVLKGILKNNKEPVHVFPSAIGVPNLYNVTSLKGILKLTTETDETNTSQKYGAFKSILKSLHIKNKTEKTNLPIASIDDEKEIAVFESEASQNELELVEHNDVDLCSSEREAQLKASQIKDNIDQEDETDDLETCRSDVTVVAASNYHINDNVWSDFQPATQSTLSRHNSTIKQVTPTHSDCSDANMNYQLSFQHVTEKILNSLFVNCCEVPVTPANSEMNFARPLSRVSSSSHVAQVDEDEETDLLTEIDEIDANDDDDGRLEYFMEPFEDTLKFFDDFDLDDEKELTMTMSDIGPTKNVEGKSVLEVSRKVKKNCNSPMYYLYYEFSSNKRWRLYPTP